MTELIDKFGLLLEGSVGNGFKYYKSKNALLYKDSVGTQSISVSFIRQNKVTKKVSLLMRIRINKLADLYLPIYPFVRPLKAVELKDKSILIINCDNLFPATDLIHSMVIDDHNIEQLAQEFSLLLKEFVLPKLRYYSKLENLVASFKQEDSMKWVTPNRETRYLTLLSYYVLNNNVECFESLAKEFIEHCESRSSNTPLCVAECVISGLRDKLIVSDL